MVLPNKARKRRLITESGEATSDISRATRKSLTLLNLSHGNRRIRRELIEVSEIELIKHNIANNKDFAPRNKLKEIEIKNEQSNHSLTKKMKCARISEKA